MRTRQDALFSRLGVAVLLIWPFLDGCSERGESGESSGQTRLSRAPSATEHPATRNSDRESAALSQRGQRSTSSGSAGVSWAPSASGNSPTTSGTQEVAAPGVAAWFRDVVLAQVGERHERVIEIDHYLALQGMAREDVDELIPPDGLESLAWSDLFGPYETLFVCRVGPPAAIELVKHVRDEHVIDGSVFQHPSSSYVWCAENMLVGEIACYLIEAILREDPNFTMGFRPRYEPPCASRRDALLRAAAEYESWVERCIDAETGAITCPDEDRPDVDWW